MGVIIFFIFLVIGIYLILADIFGLSKIKASKVILDVNKRDKSKDTKTLETIIFDYVVLLSKYIKLDEYKKSKLEMKLRATNLNISPELYTANVYVKTLLVLILGIVGYIITPIFGVIFLLLTINTFSVEYKKVDKLVKKKKEKIEYELPKFAMFIEQELKSSRDVYRIIQVYQKYQKNSALSKELEITLADMTSGSYGEALRRFESRIGSSSLSEIIRGLISVLNGSDETLYFRMLAKQFKDIEFQRLKGIALKRPQKIRVYSGMMMLSMILIYIVVFGNIIIDGINQLF